MAKQWLGFALFLASLVILVVSGNLSVAPVLLPFAGVAAYVTVRSTNRHAMLLLQRKKR
jgi:hypothetical protein